MASGRGVNRRTGDTSPPKEEARKVASRGHSWAKDEIAAAHAGMAKGYAYLEKELERATQAEGNVLEVQRILAALHKRKKEAAEELTALEANKSASSADAVAGLYNLNGLLGADS